MGQQSIPERPVRNTATTGPSERPTLRRNSTARHSKRYWKMLSTFAHSFRSRGNTISGGFEYEAKHDPSSTHRPRLPVELYMPILLYVEAAPDGRRDLLNFLTVSKAMAREIQKIIYHTLILTPEARRPTFPTEQIARMVRRVFIKLGNRHRTAKHTHWCMGLLPHLTRLESMDIRGRGWEVSVFDSCLPREWDSYEGITTIRKFTYDSVIDLPVIRFLAAQRHLCELEIVSPTNVPFSSADVLEIASIPYANLKKVTIPHAYSRAIIRLAPTLKHISLDFDPSTSVADVSETLSLLPPNLHSLVLNTSRRDFLPAHAFLPRSLRALSTVLILNESAQLIEHLSQLPYLETVVLNVYQAAVPSFINPFAPVPVGTSLSPSPPSPSPSPSPSIQGFDDRSAETFIAELKRVCPSIKDVQVDDQVYKRRGSSWREGSDGTMSRRDSYDISNNDDGSTARLWRMSL